MNASLTEPKPKWEEGVPHCSEDPSCYDGKRCWLMGIRPSTLCEPAVRQMSEALKVAEGILTWWQNWQDREPRSVYNYENEKGLTAIRAAMPKEGR